jgi:hypothetical protein
MPPLKAKNVPKPPKRKWLIYDQRYPIIGERAYVYEECDSLKQARGRLGRYPANAVVVRYGILKREVSYVNGEGHHLTRIVGHYTFPKIIIDPWSDEEEPNGKTS